MNQGTLQASTRNVYKIKDRHPVISPLPANKKTRSIRPGFLFGCDISIDIADACVAAPFGAAAMEIEDVFRADTELEAG